MIRCKDFHIFRIQSYADRRLLNKHYKTNPQGPLPSQHYERAKSYNTFQLGLIKFITGQDYKQMWDKYRFDVEKCAMEEAQELTGMRYFQGEGWETYMIPKERSDIINWITLNVTENPIKVVTRVRLGFQRYREFPPTFNREHAIQMREALSKYFK